MENKYPIIIIPGIMGSRLFISNTDFTVDSVAWDPAVSPKGIMQINERLDPSNTVYVRPCEDQNVDQNKDNPQSTVDEFGQEYGALASYKEIVLRLCEEFDYRDPEKARPVYFFSFDWRRSNVYNAVLLRSEIYKTLQETGAQKVDLVCHSMGGLVASRYYTDYRLEKKINKIITVGTPFEGAPKLLNSVLNWDVIGTGANPFEKDTWTDIALALLGGMRGSLKASFDGVAELCPTDAYTEMIPMRKEVLGFPHKTFRDLPAKEYKRMCEKVFGEDRYTRSREFHNSIRDPKTGFNNLLSYDRSYFAFGTGKDTICAVRFDHRRVDVDHLFYEEQLNLENKGDATVPFLSASMMGRVLTLPQERWHTFITHHNGLVQTKDSLDWIVDVLKRED